MSEDEGYNEMIIKLNEIVNELRNHDHTCKNKNCCVKSMIEEINFE